MLDIELTDRIDRAPWIKVRQAPKPRANPPAPVASYRGARGAYSAAGDIVLGFPYHAELVAAIKARVPSNARSYDPQARLWWVARSHAGIAERLLRATFPDATISRHDHKEPPRRPLVKERLNAERAFSASVDAVLSRDDHACGYCGLPAAHADQWKAGIPSPDTMVACCLACRVAGRNHFFPTIQAKADWLQSRHWQDGDPLD